MKSKRVIRVVVTDASVIINLVHVGRLGLLSSIPGFEFVVADEVLSEVTEPDQADALSRAIDDGHLERESISEPAELLLFAEHVQTMGRGEASCFAMAEIRGYLVACDERRRFPAVARERLGSGRVLNTSGLYVLAIRAGALTIQEADNDKAVLESRRFKMKFASFNDVIGNDVTQRGTDNDKT